MGKRGPPPLPTAVKKLRGTHRKDRAAPHELAPPPGVPVCPKRLDKLAREEWDRIVPQLAELGVLTELDGSALETYCFHWSQAVKYRRLAGKQPMVKTPWGPKPNPAGAEARKHDDIVKQYQDRFGLSPSARSRVNVPEKKKPAPAADPTPLRGPPQLAVVPGGSGA
jgi:P27 family predicted phage terminase small subunit